MVDEEKEFKFENDVEEEHKSAEPEDIKSNDGDVKTDTSSNEDNANKETSQKKQNSKTNAMFKEKRLQKENSEKNIEEVEKNAYVKGKIDALKKNPYTNKEIKTRRDLEIYEAMKEAEDKGFGDPAVDGYEIYFQKQEQKDAETQKKLKEASEKEEIMKTQINEFKNAIPDENERNNLLKDTYFKDLYEEIVEKGGDLGKAALAFKKLQQKAREDAEISIKAKLQSQAPSPNGGSDNFRNSIEKMSDKEIDAEYKKRFGGY